MAVQSLPQNDILVFISNRERRCDECTNDLGSGRWYTLNKAKNPLCLSCSDLDHLEFLPPGDAALTRRAKKYSNLWAIVLKWSKARKHYERQGLLVENDALCRAEKECMDDADARARRREREAERREYLDASYVAEFAQHIRREYPHCPKDRELEIATHACQKYSQRIGRTQSAKDFVPEAIELAVAAHVRHRETKYDELILAGMDRVDARRIVRNKVAEVLAEWKLSSTS